MGEKLFTAKEAAEILKVRKNTVYDMIKRGDLKASKLGKQLRGFRFLYSVWKSGKGCKLNADRAE